MTPIRPRRRVTRPGATQAEPEERPRNATRAAKPGGVLLGQSEVARARRNGHGCSRSGDGTEFCEERRTIKAIGNELEGPGALDLIHIVAKEAGDQRFVVARVGAAVHHIPQTISAMEQFPCGARAALSARRPRWMRDFTVPTSTRMIAAISP